MPLPLRRRQASLVVAAAFALSALPALHASAAPTPSEWTAVGHGATVLTKGVPGDGRRTVVPPTDRTGRGLTSGGIRQGSSATRPHLLSETPLCDIVVNYDAGFQANPPAMAAFDAAVAIWERAVVSTVPIEVDASLAALPSGVLGGAGPTGFFDGGGVLYPVALANALDGSDLNAGASEIDAQFTDNTSIFYYGTDGLTPIDVYDFETVVLHELGHGLGFLGSVEQYPGDPQAAYNDPPFVWDFFAETSDGTPILDFPNGSQELTDAVTGGAVYWNGPHGSSADQGREPRLYAPNGGFESGSSYSHLSEASYPDADVNSLMTPVVDTGDATHDPGEVMLGMFRDMGWVTPGLPGSTYTPLQPVRLLDTGKTALVPNGATRDITVTGANGVPNDATAVVVNVTSSGPNNNNVVRVYPLARAAGAPVPTVSNLNTAKGDTRANLATVAVGKGGRIRLLTTGGATRLVVDLAGYYAPAGGSYFHPRTPVRIMDTRSGLGPVPQTPVGTGSNVPLTVAGNNGVPSGATAVVLTLTAVTPTTNTYVTAYPADGSPGTSNLNLKSGTVAANQVIVKLSPDGTVRFRNSTGAVHLIADLAGWFDADTAGALFRPALTQRVKDSRPGGLGAGRVFDVGVTEQADGFWGVPDTATTAIVNLTGVLPTVGTYLQLYPPGPVPTVSNLNLAKGQTAAASATVMLGSGADAGKIRVRNSVGSVPFIVDLQGWYGPA